jgi:hypothetical protein
VQAFYHELVVTHNEKLAASGATPRTTSPTSPSSLSLPDAAAGGSDAGMGININAPGGAVTPPPMSSSARRNVISLGDSVHERMALQRVTAAMGPDVRTKSVKFVERPSVEQLKRQVDLIHSCFADICRHDGSLDLMLTIQLLYN